MSSADYRTQVVLDAETDKIRQEPGNFSRKVREALRIHQAVKAYAKRDDDPMVASVLWRMLAEAAE